MTNARLVILFLGVTVLGALGGCIMLANQGKTLPDVLVGTLGTALGALGAVLAKTSDSPSTVNVAPPSTVNVNPE